MSWVYFCASSLYTKQQPPKEAGSTEEALRLRFAFDKKTEQAIKSLLRSVFILQKRCQSKRVAETNAPHFREERDVCAG